MWSNFQNIFDVGWQAIESAPLIQGIDLQNFFLVLNQHIAIDLAFFLQELIPIEILSAGNHVALPENYGKY